MKPIILAFLLMLFAHSPSFGVTNCRIVEYVDRSEAICIGDEKAVPESAAPAMPTRATIADYIAQNQTPPRSHVAEAAASTVNPRQAVEPSGGASPSTTAPAATAETPAAHQAKRREQATRNSRNLMNYTSAAAPSGQ